jgi:multidrug efflux pump subunit AcrA (membrane-fusion protein)
MRFLHPALARLHRAEEPYVPVVLAGPKTLLLLVLVTLLVLGGAVWACVGSLSQTVYAPGILTAAAGRIEAVVYVLPGDVAGVQPGQSVDLEVSSVSEQRYGALRGTVSSIGSSPQTRGQLAAFLADPGLAGDFLTGGEPFQVAVRLTPGPTPSGYRWSTPQGPPGLLGAHTLLRAAIHLPPVKPVSLVVS